MAPAKARDYARRLARRRRAARAIMPLPNRTSVAGSGTTSVGPRTSLPYRFACDNAPHWLGRSIHEPDVSLPGRRKAAQFGTIWQPPITKPIPLSSQADHAAASIVNVPNVAPSPVTVNQLSLNTLSSLSITVQPSATSTSVLFAFISLGSLPKSRHVAPIGSVVRVNSRSDGLGEPGHSTEIEAASSELAASTVATNTRRSLRTRVLLNTRSEERRAGKASAPR